MNLVTDEIDYSAYMIEPEARQAVKPASYWRQQVVDSFMLSDEQKGSLLPWGKARDLFRLRTGELTLWPGINGHGKSILLSQVMACLMAQGEKCLIASMEMRPRLTLNRMARQCIKLREPGVRAVNDFSAWTDDRLWLYDHLGSVEWKRLLAIFRWAADKLQIRHFVIDSLMRCGIREDDYSGQKDFVDALCTFKSDYEAGVHLVMHARKGPDEYSPPGKFDAKGTGTMTDLADNVLTVWRNKKKEAQAETGMLSEEMARAPDTMLICDKQRNFDWEGRIGLWYHRDSMQFVESVNGEPVELMEFLA
jgi:twinkle protein